MNTSQLYSLSLAAALCLTACGGGSSDASTSASSATPGNSTASGSNAGTGSTASEVAPVTSTYTGYYRLQDLTAPGTAATYVDKGQGIAGTLSLRSQTITMTPRIDGGIAYGAPITLGVAISQNATDANLPVIAMLCQAAATGDGTNGNQASDVLVASSATRLMQASDLAGKSFSVYREDCATVAASTLSFDASGNATSVTPANGTVTLTAAQVTAGLAGSTPVASTGRYDAFYAYSYKKLDNSTAYAVVQHGSPSASSLTRGFVSVWSQQ